MKKIVEKSEYLLSNLVNIGSFVVDDSILNHRPEVSSLGEVLVTDTLTNYAQTHSVKIIEQDVWIPAGHPDDIRKSEVILCN